MKSCCTPRRAALKRWTYRVMAALSVVCLAPVGHGQTPVNPNATPEARSLLAFMHEVYGKRILSGQVNERWLALIEEKTGEQPAILGLDFDGIAPSQGGNSGAAKAIDWVKNRGGVVQFQWHWISPNGDGDYYGDPVKFDLAAALADPEGQSYQNLIRDLDLVAAEIAKMQAEGVPILWRPLHEAEGRWFWWGMSGKAATVELYRLIYERFTNFHHLNNIIWIWNSYGDNRGNWYPGDDVCDIIAYDYEEYDSWSDYQRLFGDKGKLFGLAEEGKHPSPENFAARPWSFFICWDYMIQDPAEPNIDPGGRAGKNPTAWTQAVYSDPNTLNLSDLAAYDIYGRFTPLTAKAGPDQTLVIESGDRAVAILDGSGSIDREGSITGYEWSMDGQVIATGPSPVVELPRGDHVILLTCQSSIGNVATDSITVRVKLPNLAMGRTVVASSMEATAGISGGNAVDGDPETRWASLSGVDPQSLQVDLGSVFVVTDVLIDWETASAKDYQIDVSTDGQSWKQLASLTDMAKGEREDSFSGYDMLARFVRILGTARTSQWGYSIWELEVNGYDPMAHYLAWQARVFSPEEIGEGLAEPFVAAAADGVPNLFKYALGSERPQQGLPSSSGPRLVVAADGSATLRIDRVARGVEIVAQKSVDLAEWVELPTVPLQGGVGLEVPLGEVEPGDALSARVIVSFPGGFIP